MKFSVLTLFPDLIEAFLQEGLVKKAVHEQKFFCDVINPRQFTDDVHQTVDDRAFGGTDGMVMKVEPLAKAIKALKASEWPPTRVVLLSPQGKPWKHSTAEQWAREGGHVVLVCGRYAGVDQRFRLDHCDEEISLGDYVLNGGELAACVLMESTVRLLPGVLGNVVSAEKDSFAEGLLEAPLFTRPREVAGRSVPEALLSGNHQEIRKFERAVSLCRTKILRPDLWTENFEKELRGSMPLLHKLSDMDLSSLGLSRQELNSL